MTKARVTSSQVIESDCRISVVNSRGVDDAADNFDECVVLTPVQAQLVRDKLRASNFWVSPWRMCLVQLLVGAGLALAGWVLTQDRDVLVSMLWGAASVVLPAAVFARAYARSLAAPNAAVAMLNLFCWELVKIGLTIFMLVMAVFLISVNWVVLLLSFVLTLKAYWLALLPGRSSKTLIQ